MAADDAVPEILRRIQAGLAEQGRKLDVLADNVESLFRKLDDLSHDTRKLRGSAVTFQDLNQLESRVTALETTPRSPG